MARELQYRSTIISRPYFYIETKKLAEYILQGFTESDIRKQVMEENILQIESKARKREVTSAIFSRLKVLDDFLLKKLVVSDVSTSKIIALYAIVKTDRLFYEFMNEVFSEKVLLRENVLTDRDFNIFFESKRQQSERVATWVDYTFYKLQQVYIRILFEAGLLKNQTEDREIMIPIINQDVLEHLQQQGEPNYIRVLVGGSL